MERLVFMNRKVIPFLVGLLLIVATIGLSMSFSPSYTHKQLFGNVKDENSELEKYNQTFIQKIGKSDEHNGITFIVDSILAEKNQLMIHYTIRSDKDISSYHIGRIKLYDRNAERVNTGASFSSFGDSEVLKKTASSSINLSLNAGEWPEQAMLEVSMFDESPRDEDEEAFTWKVPFSIDKSKYEKYSYEQKLNETVEVSGQKIIFRKLAVHPTRVGLHVEFAKENTMQIFGFEELRLVNGDGFNWMKTDGITARSINEDETIYYFNNYFFKNPSEVFIEFDAIRALEKSQLDLIIDVENEVLLKAQENHHIVSVNKRGEELSVFIETGKEREHDLVNIFSAQYMDGEGETHHTRGSFVTSRNEETGLQEIGVILHNAKVKSPLTFRIQDFPNTLEKKIRMRIK
jgi:hypothetical protein